MGDFELTKCGRPDARLTGLRHIQIDHGPVDIFADVKARCGYLRLWLNRDGMDEIVWYKMEDSDHGD